VAGSVIVTLALSEIALRRSGYAPGQFQQFGGFQTVDSLSILKNFTTDEAGIYKFSPWVTDTTAMLFDKYGCGFWSRWQRYKYGQIDGAMDDIDRVYNEFHELRSGQPCSFLEPLEAEHSTSELATTYKRIGMQGTSSDWANAIKQIVRRPYNEEGFRSIPFTATHTGAPRVLIIGDSFVYGMTARPYYNCFADRLLARGYLVYNTGIPGTDPAQYAAIAKKYIPILKPDVVIVCHYLGNDLMLFPREPGVERPHEHMTNAGFFESAPMGEYLSAEEAYSFYNSLVQIPKNTLGYGFWSSTAIASIAWNALYRFGKVRHSPLEQYNAVRFVSHEQCIRNTKPHFILLDSICKRLSVPLINVIVPDAAQSEHVKQGALHYDGTLADSLFAGQPYYFPEGTMKVQTDFPEDDYHFNNSGSLKYADFLEGLLRQHGFAPTN